VKNVEMFRDGDILHIQIDLSKEVGPSSSGKTIIVGTTGGNQPVPETDGIFIGINAFKK
jgi:hypothetical protein